MVYTHEEEKAKQRLLRRICTTLDSLLRTRLGLAADPNLSNPYPVNPIVAVNFLREVSKPRETTEEDQVYIPAPR